MLPDTIHRRIDTTTLTGLAALLGPDFDHAGSWRDLKHRLSAKGYALREQAGRIVLITRPHGLAICRVGLLGRPSMGLIASLGAFSG